MRDLMHLLEQDRNPSLKADTPTHYHMNSPSIGPSLLRRSSTRLLVGAGATGWIAVMTTGSSAPGSPTLSASRPAAQDTSPGFVYPSGIAVDSAGAVYVSSSGDSSVAVFAPGASGPTAPVRRIGGPGSGLVDPQGVALDSRGLIYVSSGSHRIEGKGSITVYAPNAQGNAAPVRTIIGAHTKLETPVAIALGKRGRIYVANGTGNMNFGPNTSMFLGANPSDRAVLAFNQDANGDAAPTQSLPDTPGSGRPFDIAVDIAGNLVTLNTAELTVWGDDGPTRRVFATKAERGGFFTSTFPADFAEKAARPTRLAVGPNGALYVAPMVAPLQRDAPPPRPSPLGFLSTLRSPKAVAIYTDAEGSDTTPQRMVGGPRGDLHEIRDMAVGKDGALYVLTRAGGDDRAQWRIHVYPPNAEGDVAPTRVITGPRTGLGNPVAIAVDRDGRIYILNNLGGQDPLVSAASITVYAREARGDAAPIRTIAGRATGMLAPTALTVGDEGAVYVANAGVWNDDHGSVRVYPADAAGHTPPLRTLIGLETRLIAPTSLAVGRGDTLYVLGATRLVFGSKRIAVFAPNADGEATPIRTIEGDATGFAEPAGIAVDDDGQVYVANRKGASGINAYGPDLGAVTIYRPEARGNETPRRMIVGSYTHLNGPASVASDRAGNIYVPNRWGTGPGSVTVYGPQAEEDARPLRTIAGPATGLKSPAGLALDANDTLYVVNERTVTVYAPGAAGNAAPVRTIGRS